RLALRPSDAAELWAHGPVPGPRVRGDLGRANEHAPLLAAPDELVRVAAAGELHSAVDRRADALRARLEQNSRSLTDPWTRGLVVALLYGEMRELPKGANDLFTRTGTFHLLAVSG